jgi:metallo-beta-lactamase family protein
VDRAPYVHIFGEEVPVRAEIATLGGFSAHADQSALLEWLRHLHAAPRQLFLVHGELSIVSAFAARIEQVLGWRAHAPADGETVQL